MSRLSLIRRQPLRALKAIGIPGRHALAVAALLAAAAGGTISGMRDSRAYLGWHARSLAQADAEIALVAEVSSLADLDARSDAAWDRYETALNDAGIVKGDLARSYPPPGPSVWKPEGAPRFASTQDFGIDLCRRPIRILAAGPLADRIEVSLKEGEGPESRRWQPVDATGRPCGWDRDGGSVAFRIAPRPKGGREAEARETKDQVPGEASALAGAR